MGSKYKIFPPTATLRDRVCVTEAGCWEWQGTINDRGYGQIRINYKRVRAHRYAYELTYGPIPEGLAVCHKCDNPSCVNPEHLFLGTHQDNMDDMARKGRCRGRGQPPPAETAKEIRQRYANGGTSRRRLAREFGLPEGIVRGIITGRTHKNAA